MFKTRDSERGLSLVEVLVAVTILAVAVTIALILYDQSRKSFKRGENAAEQQQAVRIAFDTLNSDLRLAGFNYNPDGDKTRPDEQIEAAYDTAFVIRADFDAEDPVSSGVPEASLAGGQFLTVSTGNDEIVVYALAKDDGSSTDTLTFEADVKDQPRDGAVETINVPNLALVQNDPPYTLYRITLNNDVSKWGSNDFIVRTPLVENVYAMSFRYFDTVGTQVNSTFDLSSTADDIGGADTAAARNQRLSIRRIGIDLVGLTSDPDLGYTDPGDTDPDTRAFRKFQLTGEVTPRNIGMVGIKDLQADITPPSKPATPSLLPGHCGGLYITWSPNPADDQVVAYRINYGTSPGTYTGQRTVGSTAYYLGGLSHATTYYVSLQALDAAGNLSVPSNEANAATTNVNTPEAPTNLVASTNLNGGVKLTWDKVAQNTSGDPSGDPASPTIRDLAGYRIYRGKNPGFPKGSTTLIADESVVGNEQSPDHIDVDVVNCRTYYYKVAAVDLCGVEGAPSNEATGNATSTSAPNTPENVQAFLAGLGTVTITWDAVTADVADSPIYVDTYKIYRSRLLPDGVPPTDGSAFGFLDQVTGGALQYVDSVTMPPGYSYWYAVSAVDDCPNESARSKPAEPVCAFSGDVVFNHPKDNSPVAGVVPVEVEVVNGTDTYAALTLTFYHKGNRRIEKQETLVEPGPVWLYKWLASPPGPYTITASVENTAGCSKATSIDVSAGTSIGCCLSQTNPEIVPIILECSDALKQNKCREISYGMINNNCLTSVAIEEMTVDWVDVVQNGARLQGVRFDGSLIWNVTPPSDPPATNVFSDPKPDVPVNRNSSNPVVVTYAYDKVTSDKVKGETRRNTLTTSYSFRLLDENDLPTAITGVCGPSTGVFDKMIVEAP